MNKLKKSEQTDDCQKIMRSANRYFPDFNTFPMLVQTVIIDWLHQLGEDAPSQFVLATAAIQAKDWDTAADQFIYANARMKIPSKWYLQTKSRCLKQANRLRQAAQEEQDAERQRRAK